MEREYKSTDEILDYLEIIPVFDESGGLNFEAYLDGEQAGSFNGEDSEIEVEVKVAEGGDLDAMPYGLRAPGGTDFGPDNCKYLPSGTRAKWVCENAGDNDFMNCSRKCLKESYTGTYKDTPPPYDSWYWLDHPRCWTGCGIYLPLIR